MSIDNLENLWHSNDLEITQNFEVEPYLEASNNIISRILRQSRWEIFWGTLALVAAAWICLTQQSGLGLALVLIAFGVGLGRGLFKYLQLKRKVYAVQQLPIKATLTEYVQILSITRRELRNSAFILVPLFFYTSLILTVWHETNSISQNLLEILGVAILATPFLIGWFKLEFKPYLQRAYDLEIIRFQELLTKLEKAEE